MQSCNSKPPYEAFRTARHSQRLSTHQSLAQIKELWQYAGEDDLPPESLLQAQVEALRILHIDVPLSAKRQFQLFCSEHFPGLAGIIDRLVADQVWTLLSMRVQLADSDQPCAKAPPFALVASVAVTSSSYSPIVTQVFYRTPMDQALATKFSPSLRNANERERALQSRMRVNIGDALVLSQRD